MVRGTLYAAAVHDARRSEPLGIAFMPDAKAEKLYLCHACGWVSPERFALWRNLAPTCSRPRRRDQAESAIASSADRPSAPRCAA